MILVNGMINKTIFDKIYVISLIHNHDRQEFIKYQMNHIGLNFEFIYGIDFYNLINDSKDNRIFLPDVYNYVNDPIQLAKNFGCAITHYNAVLNAYELGFNNILIIEDDICFIKNTKLILQLLNDIPKDCDFVSFNPRFKSTEDNLEHENCKKLICKNYNNNFIYLYNNYQLLVGAMMYGIMNRDTMKLYLNNQRQKLMAADNVIGFFEYPTVKRYISTKCLCTDIYNINTNFNVNDTSYECIYKDIEHLKINNFFTVNNIYNIFTRA